MEYALTAAGTFPVASDEQHHQIVRLGILAHPVQTIHHRLFGAFFWPEMHTPVKLAPEPLALLANDPCEPPWEKFPVALLSKGNKVKVADRLFERTISLGVLLTDLLFAAGLFRFQREGNGSEQRGQHPQTTHHAPPRKDAVFRRID